MGHWVTLDDDQHVYISDSGKVLATRGAISSAAGGKERGKALAERSKAAVGKATGRTARAIEHARAAGPSLREQAAAARAEREISQGTRTALARALNRAREYIHNPPPIEARSEKQRVYAQDVRAKQIEGMHRARQLGNIPFARKTIAESTLKRGKLARESSASDIINVRDASSRAGAQAKKLVERFYEPAKYRSTQTFRSRLRQAGNGK